MLTSIVVCYAVTKNTDVDAMDILLANYMRRFKGDWTDAGYSPSKARRWLFWHATERYNTYIVATEDLDNVKQLVPGCFYVKSEKQWPFVPV